MIRPSSRRLPRCRCNCPNLPRPAKLAFIMQTRSTKPHVAFFVANISSQSFGVHRASGRYRSGATAPPPANPIKPPTPEAFCSFSAFGAGTLQASTAQWLPPKRDRYNCRPLLTCETARDRIRVSCVEAIMPPTVIAFHLSRTCAFSEKLDELCFACWSLSSEAKVRYLT